MSIPASPRRRRRRWPLVVGLVALIAVALIVSIPSLLNTKAGNRLVAATLGKAFAPGRLTFDTIRFSWFGPTRLSGIVLDDPSEKRVVSAPSATLSPTLWGLITKPHNLGVLDLHEAAFDAARTSDGSIDIAEALEGIFRAADPRRDLTIRAERASLLIHVTGPPTPIPAYRMDLAVQIRPAPATVAWTVDLRALDDQSLRITGELDRWRSQSTSATKPDLSLEVSSTHWPLALTAQGLAVSGRLESKASVVRLGGLWKSTGSARVLDLKATGAPLKGDTLDLASLVANWSIAQGTDSWSIDRFDVLSPLGSLKTVLVQPVDPSRPAQIEGELDLAAIARQLPHTLRLREGLTIEGGKASLAVVATRAVGRSEWSVEAKLADLAARQGDRKMTLRDPATLSALVTLRENQLSVDRLDLKTAFLALSAHGDLDRGIDLTGTLDLSAFRTQLADWLDLGAIDMAGKGTLKAGYQRDGATFTGETRMDVAGLRLAGLGGSPILADHATFSGRAEGAVGLSGLPQSITKGHLGLDAGDLFASAELRPEAGMMTVALNARTPIRFGDRPGRAEATLNGRWDGSARSLDINDLRIGLRPDRDDPKLASLTWSAHGHLDLAAGSFTLAPSGPIDPKNPLTLAPEGIKVSGIGQAGESLRASAAWLGDVAALDRLVAGWSGRASRDLTGNWNASATIEPGRDGLALLAQFEVLDLSWPLKASRVRASGPLSISTRSVYREGSHRLDIAEVSLITPYGSLLADGRIEGINGPAVIDVKGVISPDWKAITVLLANRLEAGAKVLGQPRPFHVKGSLLGLRDAPAFEADFGVDLIEADLFGMTLGATPIVVHARDRKVSIDPIDTTLNEGDLHLRPLLNLDGADGATLIFEKGSSLDGAVINDDVSRRVLAFVAPILDQSTRASGRVSVTVDRAEFPIGSDVGRKANVTGSVVFQDVEFSPGPLARQVFSLVSQNPPQSIHLDEPVVLSIADGRINQKGLTIPIGKLASVEVEGWVDFDKNLDLVASFPISPSLFSNRPLLGEIVAGTKIRVPIRGTLSSPMIDKDAFNAGMRDMGKDLLTRSAGLGALELLDRLANPRPRDPAAPPPPPRMTPEERKALRLERQNERRRARGLDPLPVPERP